VLRLLRGEDLETVSRGLGVTAATLSGWRDAFLAAGEAIKHTNGHDHHSAEPQADLLRVAWALAQIPNNGPADWEAWNRVGMALWRATGGSAGGLALFDSWSQQHPAYDPTEVRNRWDHYPSSPPSQIGAGTLFYMAKEASGKKQAPIDEQGRAELPLTYFENIQPNLDAADFVEV
jgi:hypothetical protein